MASILTNRSSAPPTNRRHLLPVFLPLRPSRIRSPRVIAFTSNSAVARSPSSALALTEKVASSRILRRDPGSGRPRLPQSSGLHLRAVPLPGPVRGYGVGFRPRVQEASTSSHFRRFRWRRKISQFGPHERMGPLRLGFPRAHGLLVDVRRLSMV